MTTASGNSHLFIAATFSVRTAATTVNIMVIFRLYLNGVLFISSTETLVAGFAGSGAISVRVLVGPAVTSIELRAEPFGDAVVISADDHALLYAQETIETP
jgi:hypothetical protein